MLPLIFLFFGLVNGQSCPLGYELGNGHCYKFDIPFNVAGGDSFRMFYDNRCAPDGAVLPGPQSEQDLQYLYSKVANQPSVEVYFPTTVPVGARTRYLLHLHLNSTTTTARFCGGHPTQPQAPYLLPDLRQTFECRVLASTNGQPCVWSESCRTFLQYGSCVDPTKGFQTPSTAPPPPTSYPCSPYASIVNEQCKCNNGFVDILDTDLPDRGLRYNVTLVFVMDSSLSLSQSGWQGLVNFVMTGSTIVPNTSRIRFIKFSDAVTDSPWLNAGWSSYQYQSTVPTGYDNLQTNTPLALNDAYSTLRLDSSPYQTVVLITDGLPYQVSWLNQYGAVAGKQYAQDITIAAAQKIRTYGAKFVVLGFGPLLDTKGGYQNIRQWLEDDGDYLAYRQTADHLNSDIMSALLEMACRKFDKA